MVEYIKVQLVIHIRIYFIISFGTILRTEMYFLSVHFMQETVFAKLII
jgi:hypothetical protein